MLHLPNRAVHPESLAMAPNDPHDTEWLGRWDEY